MSSCVARLLLHSGDFPPLLPHQPAFLVVLVAWCRVSVLLKISAMGRIWTTSKRTLSIRLSIRLSKTRRDLTTALSWPRRKLIHRDVFPDVRGQEFSHRDLTRLLSPSSLRANAAARSSIWSTTPPVHVSGTTESMRSSSLAIKVPRSQHTSSSTPLPTRSVVDSRCPLLCADKVAPAKTAEALRHVDMPFSKIPSDPRESDLFDTQAFATRSPAL